MPRPNHDISNLLLGGIRDYADREDVSVDEAHSDLLARGLRDVGIMDCIEEHAAAEVDENPAAEGASDDGEG